MRAALGFAVLALAAACGSHESPPEVALSIAVTHPLYGVRAELPDGWVAETSRAEIYPADVWSLHPAGTPSPAVTLILGWLPRGGRQSAFFPGGRDDDAHPDRRAIGGAERAGTVESAGRSFLADFDVGELAVSVHGYAIDDASRAVVDAVIAHLAFDPAARAPDHPTPARRALELARGWAATHDYPTDGIVVVARPAAGTSTFVFTAFRSGGLTSLRIDVAAGTVTEVP